MNTSGLKTYSHLATERRIPSEYDVVTSQLLYYVGRGFEVVTPLADWYRNYQSESPLRAANWDGFRDPRETTYTSYVALQAAKEAHVEGILRSMEASGYDARLSPACLDLLERLLAPLRFPLHGLQMLAAYVGQMAPTGRLTITSALQAADEMRRIQRIAYRMAQLRTVRPSFGEGARHSWESASSWQPLRKVVEELLIVRDWAEAFVGLSLGVKPLLDRFFMDEAPKGVAAEGDHLLREFFFSLGEDCRWHHCCAEALARFAMQDDARNTEVIRAFLGRWLPPAEAAIVALAQDFDMPGAAQRGQAEHRAWLGRLELAP